MKVLGRITIAKGKYTNKSGETKTKWLDVGTLFQDDEGKMKVCLDASVNIACFAKKELGHETDVWAQVFPIKDEIKEEPKPVMVSTPDGDEIPF